MAFEQTITVKIRALLQGVREGARDVEALGKGLDRLNGSGGAGAALSLPAGKSAEVKGVAAAVRELVEEVKHLQPGKLRQLAEFGGNVGQLVGGISRYKEAVAQVNRIKADAAAIYARVTAKATEFGSAVKDKVTAAVTDLSSKLPALSSGLGLSSGGMAALGAGGAAAATGVGLLLVGVIALVAAFAALVAVAPLVVGFLKSIFDRGVSYNSNLEQTRLGIAAVIASLAELRAADGRKLDGADALAAAYALAGDQLQKLKVDAINTTATFEQIAPAFQAAIGPGLAAGLNLDQIRATTVQIVQAAGALGLPMHQVSQEVRAILEGSIDVNARLAKALGISNEDVKLWKQKGALAEELNERLEKFTLAGVRAAQTLDGLTSNLKEALSVFTGEATDRAFEVLKTRIQKVLPQLFDFKNAGIDKNFQVLAEIIDDIFVRAANVAGDVIEKIIAGVKRVAQFLDENRDQVRAILRTAEEIARVLLSYAGYIAGASSNTGQWKGVLDLTLGTLRAIKAVLEAFAPIILAAADAANLLLKNLNVVSPLLYFLQQFGGRSAQGGGGAKTQEEVAAEVSAQASAGISALQAALTSVSGPPGGPGGKGKGKGGGGRESQLPKLLLEFRQKAAELARAVEDTLTQGEARAADGALRLLKDSLDRERSLIDDQLSDRLVSIKEFYSRQEDLQTRAVDAEIERERQKQDEIEAGRRLTRDRILEDLKLRQAEIDLDKKTPAPERAAQKRIAAEEAAVKLEEANREAAKQTEESKEKIKLLDRERLDILREITRERKRDNDELQAEIQDAINDTNDLNGKTSQRAITEINRRFRPLLETLEQDREAYAPLIESIELLVGLLSDRARIQELIDRAEVPRRQFDLEAARVQTQIAVGVTSERAGRERINALQREYAERQLQILRQALAIAEANEDEREILRLQILIEQTRALTVAVDEVGQRLNRQINDGLVDTLAQFGEGLDKGFESFKGFLNNIRREINRLAAEKLVEGLFGGLLKPGSGDTKGTVGGFISKLLGLAPKDDAQSKAVSENTDSLKSLKESVDANTVALGGTPPEGGGPEGIVNQILGAVFKRGKKGAGDDEEGEEDSAGVGPFTRPRRVFDQEDGGEDATGDFFGKLRAGFDGLFGKIKNGLGAVASFLGNVFSQIGSAVAAVVRAVASAIGGAFADGGEVSASPGGKLIQVAEDGHDELVVTTDPRKRGRTAALLGAFVRRTGILPALDRDFAGGLAASLTPRTSAFASGGFTAGAPSLGPALAALAGSGSDSRRGFKLILVSDEREARNAAAGDDEAFIYNLKRNRDAAKQILG